MSAEPLAQRLESVQADIADTAAQAGRDPSSITTIVVTKFHPPSLVSDLVELGVRDFGESRHQEAQPKAAELAQLALTWHFIGQLQSKKARAVRDYARVIHSVDRSSLVAALTHLPDSHEVATDVFIQINLTDDPDRGGVRPEQLDGLADAAAGAAGLRLRGLMAVAPVEGDPRRAFAAVRELSERLRLSHPDATALSIGMSGDFREAILEGATHLRIGTAITGNRSIAG